MGDEPLKIGVLVKRFIPKIFANCEKDANEFANLQNKVYSKKAFGIAFPFCKGADLIDADESKKFWKDRFLVRGKTVRVCSQWSESEVNSSRKDFLKYLLSKDFISEVEHDAFLPSPPKIPRQRPVSVSGQPQTVRPHTSALKNTGKPASPAVQATGEKRHKSYPLGNAQNAFLRSILSSLGEHSFSESDWKEVLQFFDNQCAYCGAGGKLTRDHAIPINREGMGEHHLGNLVPACEQCNTEKAANDHISFLYGKENGADRLRKIEDHMRYKGYVPIKNRENHKELREVLQLAYDELKPLATRYTKIVSAMLKQPK